MKLLQANSKDPVTQITTCLNQCMQKSVPWSKPRLLDHPRGNTFVTKNGKPMLLSTKVHQHL